MRATRKSGAERGRCSVPSSRRSCCEQAACGRSRLDRVSAGIARGVRRSYFVVEMDTCVSTRCKRVHCFGRNGMDWNGLEWYGLTRRVLSITRACMRSHAAMLRQPRCCVRAGQSHLQVRDR